MPDNFVENCSEFSTYNWIKTSFTAGVSELQNLGPCSGLTDYEQRFNYDWTKPQHYESNGSLKHKELSNAEQDVCDETLK